MGLTKEEKKAKKDAKRLEKVKAEEEVRKKLKRDELEREIAAQARRRGELDKSWREIMLKIKEPVFRQDIEVMWHTFDRAIDKKDHLIQYTMKLMNIADQQFQRTVTSFCDTIDTMINNFLSELEVLSKENDIRTAKCLQAGEDEAGKIGTDYNAAETHLQLLLYHSHTTADSLAWSTRGKNLVKEDEEEMKYVNERDSLRSYLENVYSNIWDEYKAVLKSYVTDTAENQKNVRKLRKKENAMADIIALQAKRIQNSDGLLKKLKSERTAYESGTKQAVFRERRNKYRTACNRLKKNLVSDCTKDEKLMATLVRESDKAIEWLEASYNKGDKILRLAALCRKFETQREKVLPFATAQPPVETKISLRLQSEDSFMKTALLASSGLTRLWKKISDAELSRKALLQERKLLEKENAMILRKLEEYKQNSFNSQAQKCICVSSKSSTVPPVAIEAVFEISKYKNV